MGVLAEYLKTEGATIRAEKARREQVLREWLGSLEELFTQIQEWLQLCDPDNLIEKTVERTSGKELAFGEYKVPVLKLSLVDRTARFEPLARYMLATVKRPGDTEIIRAQGAVELQGLAGRAYYLFRLSDGKWYIQNEAVNLRASGNDVVPLDAERLEAAVRDALS
jgi:hypothetical protein